MQSICSFLLQTAAKRSRESAEQASLKRSLSGTPPLFLSLDGLHRNPSLSHLLQTAAKRRWESEGQASLRRGLGRQPHHSPSMDCIAIHPSPTFFKPPRSGDGSLRDKRPSGGVWGGSPITPPSSPVPRPRHSMRTFRPSIIAARALRENASNCLSVMCSIRLSGFTEPAAVVLAVGTP